jgi:glycosyltransferase involved in cell wall biosynthesis
MRDFSVLFVTDTSSDDDCSAVQRLRVLKHGLEELEIKTGILYLGDYCLSKPKLIQPVNIPFFAKMLKQYDFVHAANIAPYVMGIAKQLSNFKLVCDIHGSDEENVLLKGDSFDFASSYHILASFITRRVAKAKSDYFVAVSEPLRKKVVEEGVDVEKTEVIYNGVDTGLFKPCTAQNEVFTATYAGAYQKWQGVENFVEAASLLRDSHIKFKMLGFTQRDSDLKDQIKEQLRDKVELFDFQPRLGNSQPQSFVQELCKSDVLVIPRHTNPQIPRYSDPKYVRSTFGWLPTKFAEYLAVGRPVIVTTLDVASEFVEEYDCGFVCDPSPQSLAEAILEAKQRPDSELKTKGMNGRRLAEIQFDERVISRKYCNFLEKFS